MPRRAEALSRMEVLVLSTLARRAMHGYEVMLELRYKHVRWWAKCEHGHLYATIARLAKRGDIKERSGRGRAEDGQRVYAVTKQGHERLEAFLGELCKEPEPTYFDLDLFLAGAFVLPQKEAVSLLEERVDALKNELAEAQTLRDGMADNVPTAARLIMEHRTAHLAEEIAFTKSCVRALRAEKKWGPFLGSESIVDFVRRTGVPVEAKKSS
jgi:DNA-binding PadR family transcriptional regulator